MTHTYCMTSRCALTEAWVRYDDDAGRHRLNRTHEDFSEELIHRPDSAATRPLFMDKHGAADAQASLH